ncbi:putative taurine dioxygenase [Gluconacetobacter johannae DSM 13595]|uniref:TauD/TfdA family dioxygenase n=1 Tax=Gluconacetobacter johannae TaxID=112140 RepID=A0A7W4J7N3_9PROT|nr:TauD/TfdA family dioxygenase [Gluconacetobacter johannae]MBB2176200.1 TauD/TfdA family dioxygenase [Gluconacetobacter johannae]GBQ89189.1 putative taurine dioxygenase [Gluconacetobacter johannae DSM 13595]
MVLGGFPAVDEKAVISKVGGNIGAEIKGIRLDADLSEPLVAFVKDALLKHKVIFFRNQQLTDAAQEKLGARFGTLVSHPTVSSAEGTRYIFELKARKGRAANSWHADMTFMDAYPQLSILRCIHPSPYGGATLWANTAAAYQSLPVPLREFADKLWALHSNNEYDHTDLIAERDGEFIAWQRTVFAARIFEAEHPVVRVHPETGEKCLVLGQFAKRLLNFNFPDSRALIDLLQSHIVRPENTLTWHWQAGDVAIWDNRATQHRAVADFGEEHRELHRVTVEGDVPVSVDGRRSRQAIAGQPNPSAAID